MVTTRQSKYKILLSPSRLGKISLKNRIIKTVVTTRYWDGGDWLMDPKTIAYYEAAAKGGPGLVIVECPTIDYPGSSIRLDRYRIDDDRAIPELRKITNVIHNHNCPAFIQFYHCGPWAKQALIGVQPVAASAVIFPSEFDSHNEMPRSLTIPEIKVLVDKFAEAAERARKAGFDGMEINAGSSHLINTFLSRFWNHREDEYGSSSLENRARFLVEILKAIKGRCGSDFPVVILINAIETGAGQLGLTLEESRGLARIIEKAGADALHIRSNWIGYHIGSFQNEVLFYPEPQVPLKEFPKELDWSHQGWGANVPVAGAIKQVVSIPVITSGRFNPALAEKALREGKTDFIGMCRPMVADTDFPRKLMEGRMEDIRPCTRCGECLKFRPGGLRCRVNEAMGTTDHFTSVQAQEKKMVVVVGAGPAGLEAARIAAERGHRVILFEKEKKMGGLIPLAALVKGTEIEDLPALVRYLEGQIKKLGVDIRLGKEFNPGLAKTLKPDVVVLATGGIAVLPGIPGIVKPIVVSNQALHHSLKRYLRFFSPRVLRCLTQFWMPLGKRVVIIGGSIQGCELAEFLVKRRRQVTVVDSLKVLGDGLTEERRARLLRWFKQKGVRLIADVKLQEITDEGLTIVDCEGNQSCLEADHIALALPFQADTNLLKQLEGIVPEIYMAGDCQSPGLILDAIARGSQIGHSI